MTWFFVGMIKVASVGLVYWLHGFGEIFGGICFNDQMDMVTHEAIPIERYFESFFVSSYNIDIFQKIFFLMKYLLSLVASCNYMITYVFKKQTCCASHNVLMDLSETTNCRNGKIYCSGTGLFVIWGTSLLSSLLSSDVPTIFWWYSAIYLLSERC